MIGSRIQAGEYITLALARKKPALKQTAPLATAEPNWLTAVHAADSKQAKEIRVIDLREVSSFTDTLVICSGSSTRQNQAIADEIEAQLKAAGEYALSVEGYSNAEWILMDYGDCVVNVFSEKGRAYYDLERLWRDGKPLKWQD